MSVAARRYPNDFSSSTGRAWPRARPSDPTRGEESSPLPWLWRGPQIRFVGLVAGEQLGGVVIGDRAGDDDIPALFPIGRRCHLVLGGQLHGVDHPQDLREV